MKKPSTKIYFCMQCVNASTSPEKVEHKDCLSPFKLVEATVTFDLKRTRWGKFVHWFGSLDISYWLSFMGGVILNSILVPHLNLSFSVSLLESFCVGCLLIGVWRERK
jgi:hypothetical protein